MIKIRIGGREAALTKFFNAADLSAALEVANSSPTATVVCLDTPPTAVFAEFIAELRAGSRRVVVRDHHDVAGDPKSPRDVEIRAAADSVRAVCGADAVVSNRAQNPACSSLVTVGEFGGDGFIIIADADMDGLTAAMKALGVTYPELDADAAILDGPAKKSTEFGLSPLGELLVKGSATLPPFNDRSYETASASLYETWVAATHGDQAALNELAAKVSKFEEMVAKAKAIAATASMLVGGKVVLVDVAGQRGYHLGTLASELEKLVGQGGVTVVRKDDGPIAKVGGVQYSLARHSADKETDLKSLLPEGFISSPETGMIGNVPFLIHVSQEAWEKEVLPRLMARFGA